MYSSVHGILSGFRDLCKEDQRSIYQTTGTPLHSGYALPQLRVLYDTKPDLANEIHVWQTLSNILIARWSIDPQQQKSTAVQLRNLPLSYSEASWTGLFNFRTGQYEKSVMALLPSSECQKSLPPQLCDFDEDDEQSSSHIRRQWAAKFRSSWPEILSSDSDTLFFRGLGDGACANIGSKCSIPHRIACTIGTSAAARVCIPHPIATPKSEALASHQQSFPSLYKLEVPHGLFCYRIDRNHVLLGGALTDGGSVIEWIRQLLNLTDKQSFQQCMDQVEGSIRKAEMDANEQLSKSLHCPRTALTTVPFLSGERSTGYRGGSVGVMYGLSRETTPTDMVQSCLEGVTLRLGAIVQRIQQVLQTLPTRTTSPVSKRTKTDPRILVSGKALELNHAWRQMIANCTGLDVLLDKSTVDGTSRGVAMMIGSRLAQGSSSVSPKSSFPEPSLFVEPLEVEITSEEEAGPLQQGHDLHHNHHTPQSDSAAYWKYLEHHQEAVIAAVSPLYNHNTNGK